MTKNKIKFFLLASVLLMVGLTAFVSASGNPYEEKLLGVWMSNEIEYISVMKNDNMCDFVYNNTSDSTVKSSVEADWSAGKKELFLTIYHENGDSTNRFFYENLTTYNISKKQYTKEDMDKIISEVGHGGYISINLPQYQDYYILHTNGNENRIEKVIKEMEIKVEKKNEISRKDMVKLKLIESSDKDFDPKKENTYFMLRIADSIEELSNNENFSVIRL